MNHLHIPAPSTFVASILSVLATALLPVAATSAHAATVADDQAPRAAVSYSDIDLATAKGRAALNLRIARAASGVCEDNLTQTDRIAGHTAFVRCRDQAIAHANDQLAARALAGQFATR